MFSSYNKPLFSTANNIITHFIIYITPRKSYSTFYMNFHEIGFFYIIYYMTPNLLPF